MLKIKKGDIVKNENLIDDFYTILDDYSVSALVQILQRLSGCKQKLDNNVNLTLLADAILMEILEVKYICR